MEILTNPPDFVGPGSQRASQPWQRQMKLAIRDVDQLLKLLDLTAYCSSNYDKNDKRAAATTQFPVFVPPAYLNRIVPGDINDPLLVQVLPTPAETDSPDNYSTDPLGEAPATRGPGLLQKYDGRVLLVTTGACAVNCRYCFRRHFPYEESPKSPQQWDATVDQIAADASIEEVILSGGDPLTLVDETLAKLINRLDSIEHLKRLRIHTRLPIMIPQRATERLLEILSETRLQTVMVIHANHASELDAEVAASLRKFVAADVMLLNQSVLLRRVNDRADVLIELSQRLLECRVLPYYLHKNDPVIGTSQFEVSVKRGIELITAMRAALPGYAVPRFVQEIAGELNKTVLA